MKSSTLRDVVTTRDGFRFHCNPQYTIERHIASTGAWEPYLLPIFNYFVRPGSTAVDVGANSGFHTLGLAKRVGTSGRVLAFEPSQRNFNRLKENLILNPELAARVETFQSGLGEKKDNLMVFAVGQEGNAYIDSEVRPERSDPANAPAPEECVIDTLDNLLKGAAVHFLKIDVEGMELSVLRGAQATVEKWRPVIVYETLLECFDHSNLIAAERWLEERNYCVAFSEPRTGLLVPTAYPNYSEDSVAFPIERALEFADFMLPAARYQVIDDDAIVRGAFILCSVGNGRLCGRFQIGTKIEDRSAHFDKANASLRYVFEGNPQIQIQFDSPEQNSGAFRLEGAEECQIEIAGGRFQLSLL